MSSQISLSGSWTGRFDYDNVAYGTPVSFDAVLVQTGKKLRGEIVEPNTFRPEATDTLLAVLVGTRQASNVNFIKTYTDFEETDHPSYEGRVNDTATRIIGRWYFPSIPTVSGTFLLARTTHSATRNTAHAAKENTFEQAN